MNASIYDVAKRAGVSISTVSRVINNSAGVKESKAAAVREALTYYDYQPSQFGRGLVTGSSKLIGVYSPFVDGSMFQNDYLLECLRGIDNVVRDSPYSLMLISESSQYEQNEKARPKFLEYVNQQKIDALIALSIPSDGRLEGALCAIMERNFPVGYVGRRFHEKGVNVYGGYEEYMLDAMRRLYEAGHRKIAFLPIKSRSRINTKIKSKAETKYSGLNISIADMTSEIEIEFLADIIKYMIDEHKVSAMICEDLNMVMRIQSMINAMGKELIKDISVISVEHTENQGSQMLPKVDCYYVPAMQMGEAIANAVLKQLQDKKDIGQAELFMPEYKERGSVRCFEK